MLNNGQYAPLSIRSYPGRHASYQSYLTGVPASYSPLHGPVSGITMLSTSIITVSQGLARPGARPKSGASAPVVAGSGVGPRWPERAAQHWTPSGGHQRRRGCGRGDYLVAAIECSLSEVGFLSKNHYPRSTGVLSLPFNPFRHSYFRWIGAYPNRQKDATM